MSVLRVALVNDYEVVVQGLAAMLRPYRDTVDVVELDLNKTVGEPVDIALYDTFAAAQGDREQVAALTGNPLVGHVVVYSWNLDPQLVQRALANGAAGYVSKSLPAGGLVAALVDVAEHGSERVFHGDEPGRIVGGDWPGRQEGLTPREAEVLALITQGLSNAQIAARAHLSINSVKSHIRSAYRRAGVTTRPQAILWGIDHGFRPDRERIRLPSAER